MSESPRRSIAELLADHALVTAAITRSVRRAVLEHARAGHPVAAWEGGKVVWIPPQEMLIRLSAVVGAGQHELHQGATQKDGPGSS